MKMKFLTLFVIAAFALTSCKKDEMATPVKLASEKVADKGDAAGWDQLEPSKIIVALF